MKYLSYFISEKTPLYGNGTGIQFVPDKEMIKGDNCNTTNLVFPNHSGTHIDFPYHFSLDGKTLNDYPASYWQFNHIDLIDLSSKVDDCQIIGPEIFSSLENSDADLLLIKTGYGTWRGTDRYTLTSPGLSANLAPFLRTNFPLLRCIGMDLISISSYCNREEGRKAHHAFLSPEEGEPILLIEDMKLDIDSPFDKVIVAPLLINNADGTPCTVMAYTEK
ncbi:MAG: cyclase family protein [Mariniphaga sp.]|nr:cyclase family protein [Mariniphaga sp.]